MCSQNYHNRSVDQMYAHILNVSPPLSGQTCREIVKEKERGRKQKAQRVGEKLEGIKMTLMFSERIL